MSVCTIHILFRLNPPLVAPESVSNTFNVSPGLPSDQECFTINLNLEQQQQQDPPSTSVPQQHDNPQELVPLSTEDVVFQAPYQDHSNPHQLLYQVEEGPPQSSTATDLSVGER